MPYSTREVSDLVTDDRLEVGASRANFSGLKKLVLLGAATLMIGGCLTPKGRNFVDNMGYTAAGTFIQESIKKEMGHNDYQAPTGGDSVLNPSTPQTRRNDYPMLFLDDGNLANIGKQIFYSGEKIYINGNLKGYLPKGSIVANENIRLEDGQRDFVIKHIKVGYSKGYITGIFDATHLAEKIGEGAYENIWYIQTENGWKEIGRVRYAVFNKDKFLGNQKLEESALKNN